MVRLAHIWSSDLGAPASIPFCEPLLARGWEVTIVCPAGERVARATARGIRHLPLAMRRDLNPLTDTWGMAQIARYILEHRFDIVHTHNIKVGLAGRVLAACLRVPVVVHTLHGLIFALDSPPLRRGLHAGLERIANWKVDAVLSQSREDMATLLGAGAIRPERLLWIGNGIDLSRFVAPRDAQRRQGIRASLGIAPEQFLFLSAGRLVKEKGFVELFQAAALARQQNPNVCLAVAGPADVTKPDSLPEGELAWARQNGSKLLGERDDMEDLYDASDAVVLASWREGIPRVLMEGSAMGKPLLTTDVRGCREVVESDREGLRVPVRDARALSAAMLRLANDPEMCAAMGAHNAARAQREYDIRAVVNRVVNTYDTLLAKRQTA